MTERRWILAEGGEAEITAGVRLINLHKEYPGRAPLLDEFSLEVRDHEFLVLVGPSGCGKSTLLRIIAGLEDVNGGEVYIDDRLVTHVPPQQRGIAMVFQNYALYPHMTVEQNLAFSLLLRRVPLAERRRRVREVAEILGIGDLLRRRPHALSGGQQQRVALGRALVRRPALFLLDEPLSNLDAALRAELRVVIKRLHQSLQATFVYVTHDQIEAMTMADRMVVLRDGVIQQIGSPDEIYHRPANAFVAASVGSPPMSFFRATLIGDGETSGLYIGEAGRIPLAQDIPAQWAGCNRQVLVGIRAEDIRVTSVAEGLLAQVEFVENLGGEQVVYCNWQTHRIAARTTAAEPLTSQVSVGLVMNGQGLHLFDPVSECALSRSSELLGDCRRQRGT